MNLLNLPVYQKGSKRRRTVISDRDYLDLLKDLPSALSGEGPCDPAHYRTAANSGISCKPLFEAIPLTREEHELQHKIGQFNFMPRQWWERQVAKYQALFVSKGGVIPEKYRVYIN